MLIIFYAYSDRIIHKKFVSQDKSVGDYYLGIMKHLLARIGLVRPQYLKQVGRFYMTMLRLTIAVRNFLASKAILILNHSPYSPDLCIMWLFFVLKIKNEAKRKATLNYFESIKLWLRSFRSSQKKSGVLVKFFKAILL